MNNNPSINIATNHNKKCLVCARKTNNKRKLNRITQKTISLIFIKYRILISSGSRICGSHLDKISGEILENEIKKIPTKFERFNGKLVGLLDCLTKVSKECFEKEKEYIKKKTIFDSFKNIDNLTNETCQKICGWSRQTFLDFCKHITRVRTSRNRNKYELIALFRYWLRKVLFLIFNFNFIFFIE